MQSARTTYPLNWVLMSQKKHMTPNEYNGVF